MLGIGTTTAAAPAAGAGAMRYNTASGGVLQYSNGVNWNTITSTVQKATVVAKKTTTQSFPNVPTNGVSVIDWLEVTDLTGNFEPSTGIFTAPRDGNYIVSFSFNFVASPIVGGGQVEAILVTSGGSFNTKKSVVAFPSSGSSQAGASISFIIRLSSGETVTPTIWHSLGSACSLRVGTGDDDGFVNFSVAEL